MQHHYKVYSFQCLSNCLPLICLEAVCCWTLVLFVDHRRMLVSVIDHPRTPLMAVAHLVLWTFELCVDHQHHAPADEHVLRIHCDRDWHLQLLLVGIQLLQVCVWTIGIMPLQMNMSFGSIVKETGIFSSVKAFSVFSAAPGRHTAAAFWHLVCGSESKTQFFD